MYSSKVKRITLYPYFAISLAAKPMPEEGDALAELNIDGGGEAELSIKEGGGAIAAPPPCNKSMKYL